ncbi:hypothetical protein [Kitasatospora sp. NPDC047058]|uniref:hypothetical protein n=1 Tax=Kitasatospora sp. NPDC047058 TaxID=3155620 RepID=UPI0033C5BAFA
MGDDYASLSTDELCKILVLADREMDTWTVQTIIKVLVDRYPTMQHDLVKWAEDPVQNAKNSLPRVVGISLRDVLASDTLTFMGSR